MAKTYNTISTFTSGQVLTAAQMNEIGTNSNNYRVPPSCQVRRTTNQTGYASDAVITWESAAFDTEGVADPMWQASPNPTRVTIKTAGLYLVSFIGEITSSAGLTLSNPNVRLNGTTVVSACFLNGLSTVSAFTTASTLNLAANDYLEGRVGASGGGSYAITGSATTNTQQTRLTVTWLGQVS
jgi:hypothetical protein